jgi:hypothetical protein
MKDPDTYLDGLGSLHHMQLFAMINGNKPLYFPMQTCCLIPGPMAGCQRSPLANSLALGLYFQIVCLVS